MSHPADLVRDLRVRFGEVKAVAGVDLSADAGQATALLGRNGAGKPTTMKVLAGVVPPTSGLAVVAGHDTASESLAVKRSVGYCPDVGGLVPRATLWEHLQLSARGCAGWGTGRSVGATSSNSSASGTWHAASLAASATA